jgi:hypothetical protein
MKASVNISLVFISYRRAGRKRDYRVCESRGNGLPGVLFNRLLFLQQIEE